VRRGVSLAYHAVDDVADEGDPRRLVLSAERFESQVRMLQRRGYGFLTAEEVLAAGRLAPRTAALTFDDGFRSWLTLVAPLLERLGVRGTFYVPTGWIGGRHPRVDGAAGALLERSEVRALADAGMEIGAHSVSHPDLRTLDDAALRNELRDSRAAIEEITGRPCRTMAYPYGLHDERVRAAAADAGYGLAWAWLPGRWDALAAPRLPAPPRHGSGRLALKLLGLRRR
jgi:peptidoglycan/xylan/chitin deacetylase (PgdA/CDA1 family)